MALGVAGRESIGLQAWGCIVEGKEYEWIGGAYAFAFGIACS